MLRASLLLSVWPFSAKYSPLDLGTTVRLLKGIAGMTAINISISNKMGWTEYIARDKFQVDSVQKKEDTTQKWGVGHGN